ncbi:MAG: methionine--tRNA ligase subunit beta [Candidatus Harrisonbacteria bacterium CG10_big_fil_rev_8_21_14_0_10_45_28]|uniref:Methionine--tRNA ligase n=1 Tax=Candidatus Harrisonbacteria bacterium CG10_big_fil_rev_8_21_14_0_10_45_28 TaxID=1974586 RepID=A0A2H0UQL6_9BACT|nr:MAG: methionine--tRNA ligase subunit beta [Candidatus Harrisonbacteria bacterium CG10_big_fil_rev_8_21_14_0_10_45_28]
MKEEIQYNEFDKLDIRMGEIKSAGRIEDADKLLRLEIDLGEENLRIIASGIAQYYEPESLVGKMVPVLVNLAPRTLRGVKSQGMVLMAIDETDGAHKPILLEPSEDLPPGSPVA